MTSDAYLIYEAYKNWQNQDIVHVCANCEEEFGKVPVPDNKKSHGICKRHMLEFYKKFAKESGRDVSKEIARIESRSPESFKCPDLKEVTIEE